VSIDPVHRNAACVPRELSWKIRLYIKHLCRYPLVTQSVAILQKTDGLEKEVFSLTVFTNVAREIVDPLQYLGKGILPYWTVFLCRLHNPPGKTMIKYELNKLENYFLSSNLT